MHRQQASLVSILSSPAYRANSCHWYCPLPALPCSISHPSLEQKPPSRFASTQHCACVTPTAQALPNRFAYPGQWPLSQLQPPALLPVRQLLTHPRFFISLLTASACPPAHQPASCPHYGQFASSKACLKQHSHSHIMYNTSPSKLSSGLPTPPITSVLFHSIAPGLLRATLSRINSQDWWPLMSGKEQIVPSLACRIPTNGEPIVCSPHPPASHPAPTGQVVPLWHAARPVPLCCTTLGSATSLSQTQGWRRPWCPSLRRCLERFVL